MKQKPRGAAGQNFLTRGSGRVFSGPLGSGRVGSASLPTFSGRVGPGQAYRYRVISGQNASFKAQFFNFF